MSTQPAPRQEWEKGKGIYHPRVPQCFSCRHLRDWRGWGQWSCKAYDRIPQALLDNQADHRHPQAGDKGITWEAKKGREGAHPLDQPQAPGQVG